MAGHRRFSMRFSMNIIFLGWWIAGQWVTSRGLPLPKPSVSMSSNEVFPLGGQIIIHCRNEGQQQRAEFSLHKQEGSSLFCQDAKKAEQNEVIFTIFNASQSNAGIYRCIYCFRQRPQYDSCSDYSDEVHINIRDPRLPKPSIRVRSRKPLATGLNVTIECQGPENGLNYSLYKSRVLRASKVTQPADDRAEFSFFIEMVEDAAMYTCQYSRKRTPFVWSEPSDHVELPARGKKSEQSMTFLWVGCAVGVLLALLLPLLAFVRYWKRRTASTVKERNQPASMHLEAFISACQDGAIDKPQHDGVTYATLTQHSLKTERVAMVPDGAPVSCIYASVAKNTVREGQ